MGNPTMIPNLQVPQNLPAQQPLAANDPRSQYLAAAIGALQNRGQGASPQSMSENMIANMILQSKLQQQKQGQPMGMGQPGQAGQGAPPQDPSLGALSGGQPGMMGPAQGPSGGLMNGGPMGSGWASQLGQLFGMGGLPSS
jgi:hypothetical protein